MTFLLNSYIEYVPDDVSFFRTFFAQNIEEKMSLRKNKEAIDKGLNALKYLDKTITKGYLGVLRFIFSSPF